MALNGPYATVAEYRERVGSSDTVDDAVLAAQLQAISDEITLRLRRPFGSTQTAETRLLDGNGQRILWLAGSVPDIVTTAGMSVLVDLDGDYVPETSLSVGTDVWLGPATPLTGWPYEWLEIGPSCAATTVWPEGPRTVQVEAVWGFPAVPPMIRELTIMLCRLMRDDQKAGGTLDLANIDAVVQLDRSGGLRQRWLEVQRMYGRPTQL